MKQLKSLLIKVTLVIAVLLSGSLIIASVVYSYCSNGVKIPAFLASGVAPNLLLMIDNSASMYDLAYIGNQGTCYDDTYSSNDQYVGYFDSGTWYSYDLNAKKFATVLNTDATSQCSSSIYKATGQVCVSISNYSVNKFLAKGNFLNWATASKLDIEKNKRYSQPAWWPKPCLSPGKKILRKGGGCCKSCAA